MGNKGIWGAKNIFCILPATVHCIVHHLNLSTFFNTLIPSSSFLRSFPWPFPPLFLQSPFFAVLSISHGLCFLLLKIQFNALKFTHFSSIFALFILIKDKFRKASNHLKPKFIFYSFNIAAFNRQICHVFSSRCQHISFLSLLLLKNECNLHFFNTYIPSCHFPRSFLPFSMNCFFLHCVVHIHMLTSMVAAATFFCRKFYLKNMDDGGFFCANGCQLESIILASSAPFPPPGWSCGRLLPWVVFPHIHTFLPIFFTFSTGPLPFLLLQFTGALTLQMPILLWRPFFPYFACHFCKISAHFLFVHKFCSHSFLPKSNYFY